MAITNLNTGEYLKIIGFQADFPLGNLNIVYFVFANAEQRQRFESGLSEYEIFKNGQYNGFGHIQNALEESTTGTETIKDALFNACYSALKQDVFNGWIDC